MNKKWLHTGLIVEGVLLISVICFFLFKSFIADSMFHRQAIATNAEGKDYIKWVDFQVSYEALKQAYKYDVDSYGSEQHYDWITLLAYSACKNGNKFSKSSVTTKAMKEFIELQKNGASIEEITADMKYFSYYKETYQAVLGGMIGSYKIEGPASTEDTSEIIWEETYGLKAFLPIAKNFPYCKSLKEGSVVTAGDVIGYLGHTGYSTNENVNNINQPHLHFGIQLIFDESQKEGSNEIWIDCYPLIRFLYQNRSETKKNVETKEWYRIYQMEDPAVEEYKNKTSEENP